MYHDEGFIDPIDYYYHYDDNDNIDQLVKHYDSMSQLYFKSIIEFCIIPTLYQAFNSLLPVLISSLIIKLTAVYSNFSINHMNVLNIVISITVYTYLYKKNVIAYLTVFVVIIYVLQSIFKPLNQKKFVVVSFSMLHLFCGKIFLLNVSEWNSMKGI